MCENLEFRIKRFRSGQLSCAEQRILAVDLGASQEKQSELILCELLDSSDDITRYNSIVALGYDIAAQSAGKHLIHILRTDKDDDCRGAAASALGNIYQQSRNLDVISALVHSALCDQDIIVRRSAYKSVLICYGVTRDEQLEILRDETIKIDHNKMETIIKSLEVL